MKKRPRIDWQAKAVGAEPATGSRKGAAALTSYIGVRVSAGDKADLLAAAQGEAARLGGGVRATMVIRQWLESGARKAAGEAQEPA